MTTNKDLKRLVRDRMTRTGESYTTARRHVLARVGRTGLPTPGVVPGYAGFGGGQHHESTLLGHLLRQAGHVAPHTGEPYTEGTLCGLAGGIGFLYAIFEYRGLPPIVTLVAQHHPEPWLPAALGRLGVDFTLERSGSPAVAERGLRAALDAGRPVHLVVGRGVLPWHTSPALATDPYPIVVAGRHDGHYLVDDEASAARPVSEERLMAAWSAYRKGRHQRVTVGPPASGVDLAAAMRDAIATTSAHLTGPVLGNAFDVNMGLSGMARLAAQLRDRRGKTGWARRLAAPGALAFAMRRLYECLELQYTAPGGTRPLYATFLDEAADVLAAPELGRAAALFRTSGERWSAIAALALAAAGDVGDLLEQQLLLQMTGVGNDELAAVAERIAAAQDAAPTPAVDLDELAVMVEAACAAERAAAELMTT